MQQFQVLVIFYLLFKICKNFIVWLVIFRWFDVVLLLFNIDGVIFFLVNILVILVLILCLWAPLLNSTALLQVDGPHLRNTFSNFLFLFYFGPLTIYNFQNCCDRFLIISVLHLAFGNFILKVDYLLIDFLEFA